MSIHSSLKIAGAGAGVRNVWTRMERLVALKKVGRWEEGDPVTGGRPGGLHRVRAKQFADLTRLHVHDPDFA